jgi:hypothetical protein
MAVEVGSRWQVVCRHGVGVVRICRHRNGCVRLAGRLAGQLRKRTYHGIGWMGFAADLLRSQGPSDVSNL